MTTSAKLISIALLFVGLVLVNYLAKQVPLRLDATAEDIYTLSPGTRSLLAKIEEPVRVDFFFTSSAQGLPITYKNYAARVEEMLRQYVRSARGKIVLNIVHPEPDTPEEEQATLAGLQPQMIPGTGEQLYFGLAVSQADQQEVISALNPQREQFLEYDLSELIHTVQVFDKRRLGLISGLPLQGGEMNPMMTQMGQPPQPDQFIIGEWSKTFEIVSIPDDATELPATLDALAVIHPQTLSPQLQYAIDQYLLAGHPVFLAVDPSSEHMKRSVPQQQMMMGGVPGASSDLPTLLSDHGITYSPANVVGDLLYGAQVNTGRGGIAHFPHWLALDRDTFNHEAMATADLDAMVLIEAGSLALAEDSALTFTPLLKTSAQAGDIPAMTLQFAQPETLARQITADGPKTLAALVTGTFSTAFPDGPPVEAAADDAAAGDAGPGLTSGEGTLIVIADTDWIMDAYSVRRFNFLGVQAAEPLNDNLAFGANALEFLAGSSDLISIRGKGSSVRPFTVVRDMQAAAQQRYQDQLEALEASLSEVQQQLTQLQQQTGDNGLLVASPEIEETIANYQAQEVEMRRKRREIRRALTEDIDALETKLLVLNLFAAPALVGLFGLWFHRQRRR